MEKSVETPTPAEQKTTLRNTVKMSVPPTEDPIHFDSESVLEFGATEYKSAEEIKSTEDVVVVEEGGDGDKKLDEDGIELTVEAIAELERARKKKKREEKRKLNEQKQREEEELATVRHEERQSQWQSRLQSNKESLANQRISLDVKEEPQEVRERSMLLLSGEYDRQIMDEIKTAETSSSDEADYNRRRTVSFKDTFFTNFTLPSLSDITTESSEEDVSYRSTRVRSELLSEPDVGKFVDPLTGETQSSSTEEEEKEPSKESEEEESSSKSIEFDWPFDLDDEIVPLVPEIDDIEMAMDFLMELHGSIATVRVESTSGLELQRAERIVHQIVFEFLYKLFDEAVDAAELTDATNVLRKKLDKDKIIKDLHEAIKDHMVAKQFNVDLNHKMHDYYRRVGQMRCLEELSPQMNAIEYRRYKDALQQLDHLKEKAVQTKKTCSLLLASVRLDMEYQYSISLASVNSIEQCFRNTIVRKNAEILPRIVENELRRMQTLRNEISDSRLWLITRQHTLGRLCERKRHFDQITQDLTMDTFLIAQQDVTALGIKLEERNSDLNRMRDRCSRHVHQVAFIKEKSNMISSTLDNTKMKLNHKVERQAHLRDKLLKLKVQHVRLKSLKSDLHDKSGLLYKPALLHDFDKTTDIVKQRSKNVQRLRRILNELEIRIATYEKRRNSSIGSQMLINKKRV